MCRLKEQHPGRVLLVLIVHAGRRGPLRRGRKIKGAVLASSISLDAKVKFYSHTATGF